jgi:hypothetical protein
MRWLFLSRGVFLRQRKIPISGANLYAATWKFLTKKGRNLGENDGFWREKEAPFRRKTGIFGDFQRTNLIMWEILDW